MVWPCQVGESFLGRLSGTAQSSPIVERQRVVRLLVKEVLIGPDRIVVRHSIPTSTPDPVPGSLLHPKGPVPVSGPSRSWVHTPAGEPEAGGIVRPRLLTVRHTTDLFGASVRRG